MNVYKPLMIFNVIQSITILADGCTNFRKFLVEGTKPNVKKINEYVERSLMLVTALSPVIGYDKASKIAHYALDNDLSLRQAALKLGYVTAEEFDRVVDPAKMVRPYVAGRGATGGRHVLSPPSPRREVPRRTPRKGPPRVSVAAGGPTRPPPPVP